MNNKIASYFGFCVRSGKIVYGVDEIEKHKKSVFLMVYDSGMGASSTRAILKAKEKLGCPLLIANEGVLSELLHRPSVKAVAIKYNHLAKPILSVVSEEPSLKIYGGND